MDIDRKPDYEDDKIRMWRLPKDEVPEDLSIEYPATMSMLEGDEFISSVAFDHMILPETSAKILSKRDKDGKYHIFMKMMFPSKIGSGTTVIDTEEEYKEKMKELFKRLKDTGFNTEEYGEITELDMMYYTNVVSGKSEETNTKEE